MIRKAKIDDVPEIQKLINTHADRGELLHRSLNEIYESMRDYFVLDEDGLIVGCCALHVSWSDLAEAKSLVVDDNLQGQGHGKVLLESCLNEARELGISRVFALTYKPEFFKKYGFRTLPKSELPHKVWTECIRCAKFPDCGEEALMVELMVDS